MDQDKNIQELSQEDIELRVRKEIFKQINNKSDEEMESLEESDFSRFGVKFGAVGVGSLAVGAAALFSLGQLITAVSSGSGFGGALTAMALGTGAFVASIAAARKITNNMAKREFQQALDRLKAAIENRDKIFSQMQGMTLEEAKQYMKSNKRVIQSLTNEQINQATTLRRIFDESSNPKSDFYGAFDKLSLNEIKSIRDLVDVGIQGQLTQEEEISKTRL